MKSFITSQFWYCPLTWMFHSRALNNKINSIHDRVLRITYNDCKSTFEELLNTGNSVSIHHRNLLSGKFTSSSLVVSDLRSGTKSSLFESGCYLCTEVSSLQ